MNDLELGQYVTVTHGALRDCRGIVTGKLPDGRYVIGGLPGDLETQFLRRGMFETDAERELQVRAFYEKHWGEADPPPGILKWIRRWFALKRWWRQ